MSDNFIDSTAEDSSSLVVQPTVQLSTLPALTVQTAIERYNLMVHYCTKLLKDGVDYSVPFESKKADKDKDKDKKKPDKKILLKPGAEKLATLFNLEIETVTIAEVLDWEKEFFYVKTRTTITRDGKFITSQEGSCNNFEKKYRYRTVSEKYATAEEKKKAVSKFNTANGYTMLRLPNEEGYDLIHTILRMASKRSMVAAVLVATGASEFFSQDLDVIASEDPEDLPYRGAKIPEDDAPPSGKEKPKPDARYTGDKPDAEARNGYVYIINNIPRTLKSLGIKLPPQPKELVGVKSYGDIETGTLKAVSTKLKDYWNDHVNALVTEYVRDCGIEPLKEDGTELDTFDISTGDMVEVAALVGKYVAKCKKLQEADARPDDFSSGGTDNDDDYVDPM
jgi:hypothetical protein